MGTKAFLQKGRTRPGIVLPANAVAKVNQAGDRSALVRAAEHKKASDSTAEEMPVKTTSSLTMGSQAVLTVGPPEVEAPKPEPTPEPVLETPEPPPAEPEPVQAEPEPAPEPEQAEPEPVSEPEPEQAEPEPQTSAEPEPEPVVEEKPNVESMPLTVVGGIGAALAERFATYGYKTLADLAKAQADSINQIPGARQRGRQWIDEARKRLGLL